MDIGLCLLDLMGFYHQNGRVGISHNSREELWGRRELAWCSLSAILSSPSQSVAYLSKAFRSVRPLTPTYKKSLPGTLVYISCMNLIPKCAGLHLVQILRLFGVQLHREYNLPFCLSSYGLLDWEDILCPVLFALFELSPSPNRLSKYLASDMLFQPRIL